MDRLLLMGNRTKQNSDGLPELNDISGSSRTGKGPRL